MATPPNPWKVPTNTDARESVKRRSSRGAFLLGVLASAALVAGFIGISSSAAASSGAGNHFTANYQYPAGTFWTCSGTHVANNNVFKDNETCLVTGNTTGFVAGTYTGNPWGNLPPYGSQEWASDSTVDPGAIATSWTITETANSGGSFTLGITAFYSS